MQRLLHLMSVWWSYGIRLTICSVQQAKDADRWTVSTDEFSPNVYQASPYVANGYFGQRLPAEGVGHWTYRDIETGNPQLNSWPLDQPRTTFGTITGFWNVQQDIPHPILPGNLEHGGESVISGIPDWTGLTLTTSTGQTYQPGVDPSSVETFFQSLSYHDGVVHTNVTWRPSQDSAGDQDGPLYQLNYTVVAHRKRLNLGLVRMDVHVSEDASFIVTDILDGAAAVRTDAGEKDAAATVEYGESVAIWTSVRPRGIPYCTSYVFSTVQIQRKSVLGTSEDVTDLGHDASGYDWVSKNQSTVARAWRVDVKQGDVLTVYKYVGIASSTDFPDNSFVTARNSASRARHLPWDRLMSEHTLEWDSVWHDADIMIPSSAELQLRARACLFHILSSLLPTSAGIAGNSISVGGLSSDSYAGLILWDAETWIYPSVLALYPDYAAGINEYRQRLLDQAVCNGRRYGYAGALYPWTSGRFGNCTGTGVCKGYQYHLNTDIALAHWQYFLQTGNKSWLAESGWPVMKQVADMFAAYVTYNDSSKQYNTIQLGEPDEFAYHINNGAFTNAGIKMLLGDWAPSAAEILGIGDDIPTNWTAIANQMYIPFDNDGNIIIEFDGMDGNWRVKQASVGLVNYPLGFRLSDDQARNDVSYYASVNAADGPAMTWSIYGISEAQLQERGCAAYTYLQRSSEPYMRGPFLQFSETMEDSEPPGTSNPAFIYGLNPAFPFLTGAGGFLQLLTHGITGLRTADPSHLFIDPLLPPQLVPGGVHIKGLKWRGAVLDISLQPLRTTVTRRIVDQPILTAHASDLATVRVPGSNGRTKIYRLAPGDSIDIPTRRPDLDLQGSDLALCKTVTSNTDWAPGNYPFSMVDGSSSTFWQPGNASNWSSSTIDFGEKRIISGVTLEWGVVPPRKMSLSGSLVVNPATSDPKDFCVEQEVHISAPYNAAESRLVQIRPGNKTEMKFAKNVETRYMRLSIKGSFAANDLGATVAQVHVYGATPDYRENNIHDLLKNACNLVFESTRHVPVAAIAGGVALLLNGGGIAESLARFTQRIRQVL